jgi:hypothetical protein
VATPVCPGGPPRGRAVTDRVVEVHALGCSRVRKAAGWHPEEHGLPDPSRNFVAVDCWDVLRIDDRLDYHIAAGVAQKAADWPSVMGPTPSRRQTPPVMPSLPLW